MLTFNCKNSLSHHIVKNNKKEYEIENGVYSIPCKDCDSGETGRKPSFRLEEHKRDCTQWVPHNTVARQSLDLDHRIDCDNANMTYKSNNVVSRRIVEGAFINEMNTFENNKSFTERYFHKLFHLFISKNQFKLLFRMLQLLELST